MSLGGIFLSKRLLPSIVIVVISTTNLYATNIQRFNGISFANPAQLSQIQNQEIILGAIDFIGQPKFQGTSYNMKGVAYATQDYFLPYFRYATRLKNLSNQLVFALDITRPFASNQYWGQNSIVRYATVQNTWESVDFSPNLSFSLSEKISLGAGFDALYLHYITNMMKKLENGSGLLVRNYNNWGYGWHAGLFYEINSLSHIGLTYYSAIQENMHGFSSLPGAVTTDSSLNIRLPSTAILSFNRKINSKWTINNSISYTWWHFGIFNYMNTAVGNTQTPYNFHNTIRFAWGNQYTINKKYSLNGGLSWDQGPTNNIDRTINTSTVTTVSVSLGLHYQINKPLGIELNYGYSRYAYSAPINNVRTKSFGYVPVYTNSVEARLSWKL